MIKEIPWQKHLYDYALNRLNTLGYNLEQKHAINMIFNPNEGIPKRFTQTMGTLHQLIPKYPRLDIPIEQLNFNDLSNQGQLPSHQIGNGTIIIGPPGTGKTEIICMGAILYAFQEGPWTPIRTKRKTPYPSRHILIGTFTNAGAERVIEKLYEIAKSANVDSIIHQSIRLVQAEKRLENPNLINVPDQNLIISTKKKSHQNEKQWKTLLNQFNIFVGTVFSLRKYSYKYNAHSIIVDEASQLTVPQLNLLIPGFSPDTLIVVGDDKQLPPIAQLKPLSLSALTFLMGTRTFGNIPIPRNRIVTLITQYRMHPAIGQLTENILRNIRPVRHGNNVFSHLLTNPNPSRLPRPLTSATTQFLTDILDGQKTVVILDTSELPDALNIQLNTSRSNPMEAKLVDRIFRALRIYYPNLQMQDIIATSPYAAQKELLRNNKKLKIRSGTIHSFQGQEAPVVIYSLTFAEPGQGSSFFTQLNLMYVGLSRAKQKLIILGNNDALDAPQDTVQHVRKSIFQFQYDHSKDPLPYDPVCYKRLDPKIIDEIILKF